MLKIRYFFISILLFFVTISQAKDSAEKLSFGNQLYDFKIVVSNGDTKDQKNGDIVYQSIESEQSAHSFNTVLFNGKASRSNWKLEISFFGKNRTWSPWQKTNMKIWPNGRFWIKCYLQEGQANKIRYRILNPSQTMDLTIHIYTIDVYDGTADKKNNEYNIEYHPLDYNKVMSDSIQRPIVIDREARNALPSSGTQVPHQPYRMALHHTAMQRITTLQAGIAEMQFIQDFHMNTRGWKDIGYHYCIDDSGRIYEGVPDSIVGTHAGGANTGNIGVSMMGYFESVSPPPLMIQGLIDLYAYLSWFYGINPDSLMGHRDYTPTTTCPGEAAYAKLEEIRNEVRKKLAAGKPYIANPYPIPFSIDVESDTQVSFFIRDEVQGVNINSIKVWLNDQLITPDLIEGTATEYYVQYQPQVAFENSSTVNVKIQAYNLAATPDTLNYTYSFKIKGIDVLTETMDLESLSNGSLILTGMWVSDLESVQLPGLQQGEMLMSGDPASVNTARIYPDIVESGNYEISMAFNRRDEGQNVCYRIVNSDGTENTEFIEYNTAFENRWGKIGTGPVYFSAGKPSTGYIELLPVADITNTIMIDAFRLQKQSSKIPPAVPELKYVILNDNNKIEICWFPSLESGIRGYRLFMSTDGREWSESFADENTLMRSDTIYRMPIPQSGDSWYFRMVTVDSMFDDDENGNYDFQLSEPSDIYGLSLKEPRKILIVDNFDRRASWSSAQHFFARSYGHALQENGVGFETCVNDAVQEGRIDLQNYQAVIYFCGDDARNDEAVSAIEMIKINEYLTQGGRLFISGSEIGYDLGRNSSVEKDNFNNILKANYLGDDSGIHRCEGAEGTIFDGLNFTYGAITEDTYLEDWPDFIGPSGGSEVALYYAGSSKAAAIQYTGSSGKKSSGICRLVYFSFPFETIYPQESRTEVMKKVLEYFDIETTIDDKRLTSVPKRTELFHNYPNPFNPETVISYQLSVASRVNLSIYNLLGQKVATLVSAKQPAGKYTVNWNADDLASGMYICRFESGSGVRITKKMILLR